MFPHAVTASLLLAVLGSGSLSLEEFKIPGTCPKLGPMPACYLVFASFVLALVGHLGRSRPQGHWLFLACLTFPTVLAFLASIGEMMGMIECPRTAGGIPMCYLSLGICCLAWLFWWLSPNRRNFCDGKN